MNSSQTTRIKIEFFGEYMDFILTSEFPVALIETDDFREWLDDIKDTRIKARIIKDVNKMHRGLFGDWKDVSDIFEMRLNYGSGYRVYYAKFNNMIIVLLGGGDKSSQKSDIKTSLALWKEIRNEIKEI